MTTRHEDTHPEPVTVFESSDTALLAVAESLLEEADIEFFAKGEGIQDLFAGGRIGTGFNADVPGRRARGCPRNSQPRDRPGMADLRLRG